MWRTRAEDCSLAEILNGEIGAQPGCIERRALDAKP